MTFRWDLGKMYPTIEVVWTKAVVICTPRDAIEQSSSLLFFHNPNQRNPMKLRMTQIDPTYIVNPRGTEDTASPDYKALRESMMKRGFLLQPVKVVGPLPGTPDMYGLVAGFRRYQAAQDLGWTTLDANDNTAVAEQVDMLTDNLVENLARKNLTTYETAVAVSRLREAGATAKSISSMTGLSVSYVNNLTACINGTEARGDSPAHEPLPMPILDAWRIGKPVGSAGYVPQVDDLRRIVGLPGEERLQAWSDLLDPPVSDDEGEGEGDDEGEGEGSSDKPKSKSRPSKNVMLAVLKALKEVKAPQVAIQAVEFSLGRRKTISEGKTLIFPTPEDVGGVE